MKTNTLIPFLCAADFFKKHTPCNNSSLLFEIFIWTYINIYWNLSLFPYYFLFIDCFVDFTNLINILAVAWNSVSHRMRAGRANSGAIYQPHIIILLYLPSQNEWVSILTLHNMSSPTIYYLVPVVNVTHNNQQQHKISPGLVFTLPPVIGQLFVP